MHWTPKFIRDLAETHDATIELLEQLKVLGFGYKTVHHYEFSSVPESKATWKGMDEKQGVVTLYGRADAEAVIHELAHGWHECLYRKHPEARPFGEDYAEAIRWFVETKMGKTSWKSDFSNRTKKDDRILNACQYDWSEFVQRLQDGKFTPD